MAVQGENTVFMFNYEKIEWMKPTSSPGCHEEITVCPNIGALVSYRLQSHRCDFTYEILPFVGHTTYLWLMKPPYWCKVDFFATDFRNLIQPRNTQKIILWPRIHSSTTLSEFQPTVKDFAR